MDRLDCVGTVNVLKVEQMTIFGIREISKRAALAFTDCYISLPIRTLCSWALSSCPVTSSVPDKELCAGASWVMREEKENRGFWNVGAGYRNSMYKPKDLRTNTRETEAEIPSPRHRVKETVIWTLGGVEAAQKNEARWASWPNCWAVRSHLKD